MNVLVSLHGNEMTYRLGWMLIHTLWLGAAVAAVFAVAMVALRRRTAKARYLVACVAMMALVAGAVAAFVMSSPPPAPALVQTTAAVAPVLALDAGEGASLAPVRTETPLPALSVPTAPLNVNEGLTPAAPAVAKRPAPVEASRAHPESPLLARVANTLEPALPWLVLAWTLGVCLLALWQLTGWVASQRLKRLGIRPPDSELLAIATDLARRLGISRAVKVLESALIRVPTVIGWLRPVILLPLGFATGLTPAQVEAILVHELGHIRRYDYLVNLLQSLVETLMFYHPATWYISRRIRAERENCCDDVALAFGADEHSYAESLLHLAQHSKARGRVAIAGVGMAATGKRSELHTRIGRVLGADGNATRLSRTSLVMVLAAIVLASSSLLMTLQGQTASSPAAGTKPATQADRQITGKLPELRFLAWQEDRPTFPPAEAAPDAWRPNGRRANTPEELETLREVRGIGASGLATPRDHFLQLWFSLPDADSGSMINLSIHDRSGKPLYGAPGDPFARAVRGNWLLACEAVAPKGQPRPSLVDIVLEYAVGPWEKVGSVSPKAAQPALDGFLSVTFGKDEENKAFIETRQTIGSRPAAQYRFIAVTNEGREVVSKELNAWTKDNVRSERHFFDCPLTDISTIKCEHRPVQVATYRNVSLKAGVETKTTVERGPAEDSATQSATQPTVELKYLAMQPDKASQQPASYWRADGQVITDDQELEKVRRLPVCWEDWKEAEGVFYHLWFLFPTADQNSWVNTRFVDDNGHAIDNDFSSSASPDSPGWEGITLRAGKRGKVPAKTNVLVEYAVGEFKSLGAVTPDMTKQIECGPLTVLGIANDTSAKGTLVPPEGATKLTYSLAADQAEGMQFIAEALTRDGRKVQSTGHTTWVQNGTIKGREAFSVALKDIKEIVLKSRPTRTVIFSNVSLKPGEMTKPQTRDAAATQPATTKPAQADSELKPSAVLGRIVDMDGKGVAGATVSCASPAWTATTASDGSFHLPQIEPGARLALNINAAGFCSREYVSLYRNDDGSFGPDSGVYQMHKAGRLEGRVIGTDGKPLAGAPLSLSTIQQYPRDKYVIGNHLRTLTDAQGRFVIDAVPPGRLLLKGDLSALPIELGDGEKKSGLVLDFSQSTASVEGKVLDQAGRPVPNARVALYWKDAHDSLGASGDPVTTDAQGRYRLDRLPLGAWHVYAWLGDAHTEFGAVFLSAKETSHQDLQLTVSLEEIGKSGSNAGLEYKSSSFFPVTNSGITVIIAAADGAINMGWAGLNSELEFKTFSAQLSENSRDASGRPQGMLLDVNGKAVAAISLVKGDVGSWVREVARDTVYKVETDSNPPTKQQASRPYGALLLPNSDFATIETVWKAIPAANRHRWILLVPGNAIDDPRLKTLPTGSHNAVTQPATQEATQPTVNDESFLKEAASKLTKAVGGQWKLSDKPQDRGRTLYADFTDFSKPNPEQVVYAVWPHPWSEEGRKTWNSGSAAVLYFAMASNDQCTLLVTRHEDKAISTKIINTLVLQRLQANTQPATQPAEKDQVHLPEGMANVRDASQAPATRPAIKPATVSLVTADPQTRKYQWRFDRPQPVCVLQGWYTIVDGIGPRETVGGGRSVPGDGPMEMDFAATHDGEFLTLHREPGTGKTSWPDGATLRTWHLDKTTPLAGDSYTVLWRGDFVRDGKVIKQVYFIARTATEQEMNDGFLTQQDKVAAKGLPHATSQPAEKQATRPATTTAPAATATVTFKPAQNATNAFECMITTQVSKPATLKMSTFRLDADGKVVGEGVGSSHGNLRGPVVLTNTVTAYKDRVKQSYRLSVPNDSVALASGNLDDLSIKEGTPHVIINRALDRLTEQDSVMWLVRYSEAGKTTGSYVCLVRFVPDGGQDDSGTDAERLAQAQKTLAALSTITPATQPATKPATSQGTLHSRELSGTWAGEQDGIKATIKFYGHDHNGDAIWRVEVPNGTISARLKPVDDQETGTVALRLDYTTTATGKSGSAVIGRLERNAAGGLILAILPAASQFNSDYPAMRIILQRVATAESSSVTQPAPK